MLRVPGASREPGRFAASLPLPALLAWRFLRGRRSRLLDATARSAVAATAIGVAAMVVAMALMTGYRYDLQRKLIGGNAAVVAYPLGASTPAPEPRRLATLAAVPGVAAVSRVAYVQGALTNGAEGAQAIAEREVTLRGVDPGAELPGGGAVDLGRGADGLPAIALGEELAGALRAERGDALRLVALGFDGGVPRFHYQTVRVVGTFASGLSEFDAGWAVADRRLVERLSGIGAASLVEFAAEDPGASPALAERIRAILGPDWLVNDWQELNSELFTALKVQQVALFFVLGLIVLVSTFNVASTLIVLVRERMRAVGVLAALGLPAAGIRAAFLLYGGALGVTGTALGVALGAGAAWVLTTFELIRFDPEVAAIYFISSVPFRARPLDVLAVVGFTLAVTLAACWAPARRAARIDPAAALRYE